MQNDVSSCFRAEVPRTQCVRVEMPENTRHCQIAEVCSQLIAKAPATPVCYADANNMICCTDRKTIQSQDDTRFHSSASMMFPVFFSGLMFWALTYVDLHLVIMDISNYRTQMVHPGITLLDSFTQRCSLSQDPRFGGTPFPNERIGSGPLKIPCAPSTGSFPSVLFSGTALVVPVAKSFPHQVATRRNTKQSKHLFPVAPIGCASPVSNW